MFDKLPARFRKKSVIVPVLVVCATIALLFLMKLFQPEPKVIVQQEKTWVVNTQVLVDGEQSPQVKMFAHIESPYTSLLTSAISADVQSLQVREGQYVLKGQQLVVLDETDVQLAFEQRFAEDAEIEASIALENNRYKNGLVALKLEKSLVALAEKKLAREKKTSKTNLTSQSSLDLQKQALYQQRLSLEKQRLNINNHDARLAQLEAKRMRSQALLRQAEIDVQRAIVIAPFDGVILETSVSPGDRVRAGGNLLKMYATEQVELRAQLPQKYISVIKTSLRNDVILTAMIETAANDFFVDLDRLSGVVAQSGSGVDALFRLPNEWVNAFTIGETVELTLSLPAVQHVFSVPVSAIYGTDRIYRVIDNRMQSVFIEVVGNQFAGNKQLILVKSDALQAGDEIITTQLPYAINGLKIERSEQAKSAALIPIKQNIAKQLSH